MTPLVWAGIFMCFSIIILLVAVLSYCCCVDHYRLRGLDPSLPTVPNSNRGWLGIIFSLDPKNAYRSLTSWLIKFHPCMAAIVFGNGHVMISDPEMAKTVMHHPSLRERSPAYEMIECFLGKKNLISSKDVVWYPQRRLLASVFHHHNIQAFLGVFAECSEELINIVAEKVSDLEPLVNMESLSTNFALDVILRCMLSKSFNVQRDLNSPFPQAMRVGLQEIEARAFNPLHRLNPFAQWRFRQTNTFLRKTCLSILEQKRAKLALQQQADGAGGGPADSKGSRDLFDLMILARDSEKDDNDRLSDEDIYSQFVTFVVAGHETTARTIAWACYLLATHPDVQQKVVDELTEVLGDKTVPTLAELGRLKYLQCVIKETLRLYSPAVQLSRLATADIDLPWHSAVSSSPSDSSRVVHIREGQTVYIVLSAIHHHPNLWPNPTLFDPSRFADEASLRHSAAWMPFAVGDKNCLGQQFAMLEMKCVIAMLFRRFSFTPDIFRPPQPCTRVTLGMDHVWLYAKPR